MNNKTAVQRLKNQYSRQNAWIKENRDKYSLTMPMGTKARIQSVTDDSINSFINCAIIERLDRLEALHHQDNKEDRKNDTATPKTDDI